MRKSPLNQPLPLAPAEVSTPLPTLAPPWVALICAWLGLLNLILASAVVFLRGSQNPHNELTHQMPYSPADRLLPVPVYGSAVAIFLACVVFWQMRREPKPLGEPLVMQSVQAAAGVVLSAIGLATIFFVAAKPGT